MLSTIQFLDLPATVPARLTATCSARLGATHFAGHRDRSTAAVPIDIIGSRPRLVQPASDRVSRRSLILQPGGLYTVVQPKPIYALPDTDNERSGLAVRGTEDGGLIDMRTLAQVVDGLLRLFALGLLVWVVLSWVPSGKLRKPREWLGRIYEPVLAPVRKVIRPLPLNTTPPARLDLTPLVVLMFIWLFLHPLLMWLLR